jgi:hypothetical protein
MLNVYVNVNHIHLVVLVFVTLFEKVQFVNLCQCGIK